MGEAFIMRRGGSVKLELKSIEITTPPTKTTYFAGESFNAVGMVIMADIGGVEIEVRGYTVSHTVMTAGVTAVTITYEFAGVTKTTTQAVTVIALSTTLADNSWETIGLVAAAGKASQYWNVGSEKTISLNGTNYTVQIIGFNHDNLAPSDPRYGTSYNGGSNKAALTFALKECFTTRYRMNSSQTNVGGWDVCYMRSTVMPLFKGYMSSGLQAVLRSVNKLASSGNSNTTMITSVDQMFLLSEIEVFGTTERSYAGEGSRYAYYTAGNSRIKYLNGSASWWWLRSPRSGYSTNFVYVAEDGTSRSDNASDDVGVAVGFCV